MGVYQGKLWGKFWNSAIGFQKIQIIQFVLDQVSDTRYVALGTNGIRRKSNPFQFHPFLNIEVRAMYVVFWVGVNPVQKPQPLNPLLSRDKGKIVMKLNDTWVQLSKPTTNRFRTRQDLSGPVGMYQQQSKNNDAQYRTWQHANLKQDKRKFQMKLAYTSSGIRARTSAFML